MKYVTLITIEEIYASALRGKLVRSAEGWERVEPVVPRENPTASPIINAIARALRERVFQNEHALALYLEADIASLNGATRLLMGITLEQLFRSYMDMRKSCWPAPTCQSMRSPTAAAILSKAHSRGDSKSAMASIQRNIAKRTGRPTTHDSIAGNERDTKKRGRVLTDTPSRLSI